MGIRGDRVRFNVGGRIFETSATTLANAGRDSFFGALFDQDWNLLHEATSEVFIDRNPDCFAVLLDFLRTGDVCIPSNVPEKSLYREALFYGLLDHVRKARWGQLDGNMLRFSRSFSGQAPGDGKAIRASPDGGCCVVHGSMVHVYDWMLEKHLPINLDFKSVNDAGWIDSENIVISTVGGLGLFNTSTGELRTKFSISHEDQIKSYYARTLEFNSDHKIFSSCKAGSSGNGIGIWDQITGKQTGFFFDSQGWPLSDACRLQWLSGHNCLLVATPLSEGFCLCLLDPREKVTAWNWSNARANRSLSHNQVRDRQFQDVIVIDGTNSLCAVNYNGEIGFMELRSPRGSFSWRSMYRSERLMIGITSVGRCHPKLASHDGQLFLSRSDFISVFSGPDWVLTSRLQRSHGGSLCDFSIGGDRLFALHIEENVFDIWETASTHILI